LILADAILREAKSKPQPLPKAVGFVGDEFPLLANLSVLENALLPVYYHGIMSETEALERFNMLATRFELLGYKHSRKSELPEEMRFKAQLLRAMMPQPTWLFVSFAELETKAVEFVKEFQELFQEQQTKLLLSLCKASVRLERFQEVTFYE